MTTPAPSQQPGQPPPQQQDDGLDNPALAIAVAALLASAAATAVPIVAAVASLKIRFALSAAAMSALSAVMTQVMERPPAVTGVIGSASAQTSRMNAARRAQYVIAASKRVLGAAREARAKGEPVGVAVREALATERRYYGQHQAAMWNRAAAAGKTDMAAMEHGDLLGWYSVRDKKTSAECKKADGQNYRASRMPDIGFPGAVHPHCFPAGTTVASPSLRAAAVRWYSGELIELTTLRGHHLAVTPNHPVLTSQGWVAAGLLREGGDVVSTRFGQALLDLVNPHDYQQPALIENVLSAFSEHPGVLPRAVPVSAEDFHGDAGGRDGEVAVVWADRVLMDDLVAAQPQPRRVQQLSRERGHGAVPSPGQFASLLPGPGRAPYGVMSRLGVARVLLGGTVGHHEPVGVGVPAPLNAIAPQDVTDGHARGVVHLRQLVLAGAVDVRVADELFGQPAHCNAGGFAALPGEGNGRSPVAQGSSLNKLLAKDSPGYSQVPGDPIEADVAALVEFDRLVKVRRREGFAGHVFNLESSAGWLITDNIVTHNCRCFPGPPHPGGKLLAGSGPRYARAA